MQKKLVNLVSILLVLTLTLSPLILATNHEISSTDVGRGDREAKNFVQRILQEDCGPDGFCILFWRFYPTIIGLLVIATGLRMAYKIYEIGNTEDDFQILKIKKSIARMGMVIVALLSFSTILWALASL